MAQPSDDVSVVLVHGIGAQAIGDTLSKFLRGLETTLVDRPNLIRVDEATARVTVADKTVTVHEAWWADILGGDTVRGTFRPLDIHVLAWFPWLNLKFAAYANRPVVRAILWTLVLAPAAVLMQLTARVWLPVASFFMRMRRGDSTERFTMGPLFDEVLADVGNYLASAGRATRPGSSVADAAARIQQRVIDAVRAANPDGTRRVVVVAHSLGTVIAYHALAGTLAAKPGAAVPLLAGEDAERVSHLITIGSPLAKIRWIWPMLVSPHASLATRIPNLSWTNLRDRLDLVAGKLRHQTTWGPVHDIPLFGRAWLATAHTAYERDPDFTEVLLSALGVERRPTHELSVATRVRLLAVSLGSIAAALFLVVFALAVSLAASAAVLFVLAGSFALATALDVAGFGADAIDTGFRLGFVLALYGYPLVLGILLPFGWGRVVAGYEHYAFRYGQWPPESPKEEVDEPAPPAAAPLRLRDRISGWLLVLALLAAALPLGVVIYQDVSPGTPGPFDPGLSSGARVGYVALALFEGALTEIVVGLLLAALWVILFEGLPTVLRAYRRWVHDVTVPPRADVASPIADA
ncbi:hypothetical protein SAMN05192558_10777 [Actinokineospora alba]|uniref:Alpha/beta hydrolase n=1 Tax=Actinokineospora alba TaxID=504798 RepID=A0A1H0QQN6_9PSEU|nr:hypothetical protein [Actinokineospora alba]TDP70464.1 hypothetical protein C8E96_6074 [Actinokineospora alba]SDI31022.1 hypothetical protein SAMN05421871_10476 [Actinokineospora alba]SDP19006.1 hypothetical protein SAMN05192558_10777 [Actinokineospora alba]